MRKGIHIIGSEGIIERERPRILFEVSFAIAHAQGKSYYWFRRHSRERERERPRILLEVLRLRKGYHLIDAHAQRLSSYCCACAKVIISLVRMPKGYLFIGAHLQRLSSHWCACAKVTFLLVRTHKGVILLVRMQKGFILLVRMR